MPVTPTYPGVYLEELPSEAHTITAAQTSITVFVGYTHPFKTKKPNEAVQIFSFSDYELAFGGLYASGVFEAHVAYAVQQFFLNGGSVAYVVGLQAGYIVNGAAPPPPVAKPTLTLGGITFNGLEPTDLIPMIVAIDNVSGTSKGDITITYGNRIETFRGVSTSMNAATYVEKALANSALVTVSPASSAGYEMPQSGSPMSGPVAAAIPTNLSTTFAVEDFANVFEADSSLDKVQTFNLLCLPGVADRSVVSAALAFAERKLAFVIVDPPPQAAADDSLGLTKIADLLPNVPQSANGALYFPYLMVTDPLTSLPKELPPSGFVAGKYAQNDLRRGVWKSPAGLETTISTTTGVVARGRMTDQRQGTLNPLGVNCLRTFAGSGTVIFGARTLVAANVAFQQWWYVAVRRMALFIEQSLLANLGWAVFEPNDTPLWTALRTTVNDFMLGLFHQGAFAGDTPSRAFKVVCDETTTLQTDIDNGRVIIVVAFRPLKPAEFVVIKIAQLAGQPQA
jgi:phage tail sheath protein FI